MAIGLSGEELAYMAGILDGEGTICCYQRSPEKRGYDIYVAVANTSIDLIQWIHARFGGHVRFRDYNGRRGRATHHGTLPIHLVRWDARNDVSWLLQILLPYLVVKRSLAELATEFCSLEPWEKELREIVYSTIRSEQNLAKSEALRFPDSKEV